jgi:nitroimidazol reductase NimA-like FMN-containing flavoprotein (pyridoxamine 5'-phosphate oxidase superfamily)
MDERPPRRVRWLELTKSECFEMLAGERLGRLAFVDDRGPIVLPVNFVLDNHLIIVRTGEGAKLDAASHGGRVAFEVDRIDASTGTGWSILVRGEATEVTDRSELARLRKLPLNPWAPGRKSHYVRILPAVLTGRRIVAPGSVGDRSDAATHRRPSHESTRSGHGTRY